MGQWLRDASGDKPGDNCGQYSNTGSVLATPLFGPDVTSSDDSHYYGSSPSITVVKRTNGVVAAAEPGPYIKIGDPVTWTYEVNNSGNITLTGIVALRR